MMESLLTIYSFLMPRFFIMIGGLLVLLILNKIFKQ